MDAPGIRIMLRKGENYQQPVFDREAIRLTNLLQIEISKLPTAY